MSTPTRRLDRIDTALWDCAEFTPDMAALAQRISAVTGIPADDLRVEAIALARAYDGCTTEEIAGPLAQESGTSAETLLAECDALSAEVLV